LRSWLNGRLGNLWERRLTVEKNMLFLDGVCNLGSLAEEIEILSNLGRGGGPYIPKCVVIENIIGFVKLVAQAIIGILKVKLIPFVLPVREAGEWVVGLREAGGGRVVAGTVEAEKRHFDDVLQWCREALNRITVEFPRSE
jgi:hypothetical protein